MLMLDTDICIYIIKNRPEKVTSRLVRHEPKSIVISSITLAELEYGIRNSSRFEANRITLLKFLAPFSVVPFDADAALTYGGIRKDLDASGKPIGPMDLLIAAHAVSLKSTLVTNNIREFSRVPGLRVENWAG